MRVILTLLAVTGLGFAWQFGFADASKQGSETCSGGQCVASASVGSEGQCCASKCAASEGTEQACCSSKQCCSEEKCSSEEKCGAEQKCCSEGKCSTEQKCCSEEKCSAEKCSAEKKCCSEQSSEGKCGGTECASQCASKCSSECSSEKKACCATVAAAKEHLPKMTYLVGTESVCCSQMASELAEKNNAKVQFVVADKTYCCKEAAFTALVEETEKLVKTFSTPSSCQVSGTTSIAGKSYSCSVAAGEKVKLVGSAVKGVRMGYKVGDEEVCCVKHASKLADQTKAPIHYIADGEETTCELTARLKLATAQYVAAFSAVAAAEQSTGTAKIN